MGVPKKRHSPEVRNEAKRRYLEGQAPLLISKDMKVDIKTLRNWFYKLPKPKIDSQGNVQQANLAPAPYRRGYRWGAGS